MKGVASRLVRYAWPFRSRFAGGLLLSLVVSGCTTATAWLVEPVLDGIFLDHRGDLLAVMPVALLIIFFVKGLARYGQGYLLSWVGVKATANLRDDVWRHVMRLPISFFDSHSTGRILSTVVSDTAAVQNTLSVTMKEMIQHSATVIFLTVLVVVQDPVLAPLSLVVMPIALIPVTRLGRRLRQMSRRGHEENAELTRAVQDAVAGIRAVKGHNGIALEIDRFRSRQQNYTRALLKGVQLTEMPAPIMESVTAIGLALVIWFGGSRVLAGTATAGSFFSLLTALAMMHRPSRALSGVASQIQKAFGAAERLFEVLDRPIEDLRPNGRRFPRLLDRGITLRDVSFEFPGASVPVVDGIDLEITAGETLAIVGPSGSGKTTLIQLLIGLYEPTRGSITFDGIDIEELSLESLRSSLAIVTQEPVIFEDSIAANIAYGMQYASRDAIEAAAETAGAAAFIRALPQGFDTLVGDRGIRLSGGQKQRLALARTLLRDPPVLILDEATSALDSEMEKSVQEAIAAVMRGRTTIIIAHRLSSLRLADRVVVMDRGRIVEDGRRDELARSAGRFAALLEAEISGSGVLYES